MMSSLNEFLEKNWNSISDHDINIFNSTLPPASPSLPTPTTNMNTHPLSNQTFVSATNSPSINLSNCQENVLYHMQDIGNTLPSVSSLRSNHIFTRQLSASSEELSIGKSKNRIKHHLIDLNSNVTDTNANTNVQYDDQKEKVLELFKLNSPTSTFNGCRSQSLTSAILPMTTNVCLNPLYSNVKSNNTRLDHFYTNGSVASQSVVPSNPVPYSPNHFYYNLPTQSQLSQSYPLSPSGSFSQISTVTPTLPPANYYGFNYYQSSQNYESLNQQLINQINNNQNNNIEQMNSTTKEFDKSVDLLTPTSMFIPSQQSSKQIIDLFDPLFQNNNVDNKNLVIYEEPDERLPPPSYVNCTADKIDSKDTKPLNNEDIKNNNNSNNTMTLSDHKSFNKIIDCFQVVKRKMISPELSDYCEHLTALYLSFFSKSNCLINSGLVFSPRIEINPNKQNLDHQQMNQFYFFGSNNDDSLSDIQYITSEISDSAIEEMSENNVIFEIRFHLLVYCKLTSCIQPSFNESSLIKPIDANQNWFSVRFPSNIEKTVDMIISNVVYNVAECVSKKDAKVPSQFNIDDFLLKVDGLNEFLIPKTLLSSYVYVQKCNKANKDVVLELVDQTTPEFWRPFLRLQTDTEKILEKSSADQILPSAVVNKFASSNADQLNRYIDEFNIAHTTFISSFTDIANLQEQKFLFINIMECIQQISSFLSHIETASLNNSIELLKRWFKNIDQIDDKNASIENITLNFKSTLSMVVKEFLEIIQMYSKAFPVDFELSKKFSELNSSNLKRKEEITKNVGLFTIAVDVCTQLPKEWITDFNSLALFVTIFHGLQILDFRTTNRVQIQNSRRATFAHLLKFKYLTSTLPRETRVEFVLVGFRSNASGRQEVDAIASTYFYLYDQELFLRSGSHILPFTTLDPFHTFTFNSSNLNKENIPPVIFGNSFPSSYNLDPSTLMLVMKLADIPNDVEYYFPDINKKKQLSSFKLDNVVPLTPTIRYNTNHLNDDSFYGFHGRNTNQLSGENRSKIISIIQRNPLEHIEQNERDLIWENREILASVPGAVLKILKAPPTWSHHDLPIIYQLLERFEYSPLLQSDSMRMPFCTPVEFLQLLGSDYPDQNVRRLAIRWLKTISIDELCDYLPQLVQSLRYEMSIDCLLIWLLFEFSLISSRFCHYFYWQLKSCVSDRQFGFRCRVYLNSLLLLCGERACVQFIAQEQLCMQLTSVCNLIKESKDSRNSLLRTRLEEINNYLIANPLAIPLSPSVHVCGLDLNKCSYFNSNSLPLKIVFHGSPPYHFESSSDSFVSHVTNSRKLSSIYEKKNFYHKTIFKCGDDLRQDMLVMQIISIINRIWLRAGFDMRLIIFGVLNNANRTGMIEMVSRACTLREIQQEYGVIGSFKNSTIVNWLKRNNPSQFDFRSAVENFVHSCAGYVVITYLLGICDRHNDNIMVTTNGNLFHIDFGKFLGDAQRMAGFKRDRAPFVFTADMLYVINDGDKPTKNYQFFVELCCNCFTIVRQNGNFLLSLLSMMIPSGIFGLSPETIKYFHNALLPDLTDAQAKDHFNRLIEKALNSLATQINFLFHTIAQMKFSNSSSAASSSQVEFSRDWSILPDEGALESKIGSIENDDTSLESEDSCVFSFLNKRFTESTDGHITNLEVVSIKKHVDEMEKVYYFKIKVDRKHLPESFVYRSYNEFIELYEKLSRTFSLAKFYRLTRSSMLGRTNRREIAEQRCSEIRHFLTGLKNLAKEISHSDIVYTFFHQVYRDQTFDEDVNFVTENLRSKPIPKIKLNISYQENGFNILICHARNLGTDRNPLPDTYVKVYLQPDPYKATKRKTRVIGRNSHPVFMETIIYPYKSEELKYRALDISVWIPDTVRINNCIGRTQLKLSEIDLTKGNKTEKWLCLS